MDNNFNKKLEELLGGMDPQALANNKQNLEKLMGSPQAKNIINQLSGSDKQKILSTFMNMKNDDIKKNMKNANLSNLSNLSVDEILKKLR